MKRDIKKIHKHIEKLQNKSDADIKCISLKMIKKHTEDNSNYKEMNKDALFAISLMYEAIKRVLGMSAYDVQLKGGLELNKGHLVEIKTGEGKTLTALFPAYVNALNRNKHVYIVTVNEYLVKRDYNEMKPVYEFLGLSVGYITSSMTLEEKKENYNKNVIYITNSELGFDYLRSNMAKSVNDVVQGSLDFCIIDEADSVLIDEAKTPLIISSQGNRLEGVLYKANFLYSILKKGEIISKYSQSSMDDYKYSGDYVVDLKENMTFLTDQGIEKVESFFKIDNLADKKNTLIRRAVNNTLVAYNLLDKNRDYIIKDGKILLVDDFTGRVLEGRQYSHGLHEAIEIKEGLKISDFSETLLSITYPGLFKLFDKKSAMTGTAYSSKKEFRELYDMKVIKIPTNKPIKRVDLKDKVFKTKNEKINAICDEVKKSYDIKQPVLIGTVSIKSSETISQKLKKMGIPHQVLNAKNDEKEAKIIAKAGKLGSVTVATNMAGRGTDIKVDKEALNRGGLYVIGTQRHESKRIDDQLRGRSGRQGDIGKSQFFVSLEDDLITKTNFKIPKITFFNKNVINIAQKMVETNNYGIRKNNYYYDLVDNKVRERLFEVRRELLFANDINDLSDLSKEVVDNGIKMDLSLDKIKNVAILSIDKKIKELIQYEEYLKQFVSFYGYAQIKPYFVYGYKIKEYINGEHDDKK